MSSKVLQGNWNTLKGKIKEKWGKLTEDDLKQIEGKKDQLIGKLQTKYGYAKERAEKEVEAFESSASGRSFNPSKQTQASEKREKGSWENKKNR